MAKVGKGVLLVLCMMAGYVSNSEKLIHLTESDVLQAKEKAQEKHNEEGFEFDFVQLEKDFNKK